MKYSSADGLAVEFEVDVAERGGVEGGASDGFFGQEGGSQVDGRGQDQVRQLELAPGGLAVGADDGGGGPGGGVEVAVVPVGAWVVEGFPGVVGDEGVGLGRRRRR